MYEGLGLGLIVQEGSKWAAGRCGMQVLTCCARDNLAGSKVLRLQPEQGRAAAGPVSHPLLRTCVGLKVSEARGARGQVSVAATG